MTYVNPLHPPVKNQSTYSSLAVVPPTVGFKSKTRKHLPQQPYLPPKWKSSQARGLHQPISFHYRLSPGQGVHIRELSIRGARSLQDMILAADDPVGQTMSSSGAARIQLRINWPGLEHLDHARPIELSFQGLPINRAQLGAAVAGAFARFVEKAQYEPSRDNTYRLGVIGGGLGIDNLFLLGVHNIVDDVWMADIAIDTNPSAPN